MVLMLQMLPSPPPQRLPRRNQSLNRSAGKSLVVDTTLAMGLDIEVSNVRFAQQRPRAGLSEVDRAGLPIISAME
jgi:hypothetical protein